jgi:hypothetical protein
MKKGDTVYRLLPSGTLFTYKVARVHKDGTLTVEWETPYNGTRTSHQAARHFSLSPTIPAKPIKASRVAP